MSEGTFDDISAINVLSGLRDGDVVWVTVQDGVVDDEVKAIQHVLESIIEVDVSLVVARSDYIESLRKVPLSELLRIREHIESALALMAEHQAILTDV